MGLEAADDYAGRENNRDSPGGRGGDWARVPYINRRFECPPLITDLETEGVQHAALLVRMHTGAAVAVALLPGDAMLLAEALASYARAALAPIEARASVETAAAISKAQKPDAG